MSETFSVDNMIHELEAIVLRLKEGCHNHGCCIKEPIGQATNGGCLCTPYQIK
jgi:hypothetical protein